MKRVILVALALILLVSMVSGAAAQAPITVSVGDYTVNVGQTITIPVQITNGVNVYAGDVKVIYDANVLTGLKVARGNYLSPDFVVRQGFYTRGDTFFARYALTQVNPTLPVSGDGTFMLVTIVGKAVGTSPLTLSVALSDRRGGALSTVRVNGSVTVVENVVSAPTAIKLRSFTAR